MSSTDRLLLADLDRMDDDGSFPVRTFAAVTPRGLTGDERTRAYHNQHSGGSGPAEWYRTLGATHRQRDQVAQQHARAIQERNETEERACRGRWPAVVGAMRRLVHSYNQGTGLTSLVLVDAPVDSGGDLSVHATAHNGAVLTVTLKGNELCVQSHARDDGGAAEGERWIDFRRSDEALASYILQNWMTRL